MLEFSEKCISFQNSISMLANDDLVLPGAMKNNLESEGLRLYTFLCQLEKPSILVCAKGEPWEKEKTQPEDNFGNLKNCWLI